MVEADLQLLADDFKKACIAKIQAKNNSHKESQEKIQRRFEKLSIKFIPS